MSFVNKKIIFLFCFFPTSFVFALNVGSEIKFNIDPNYDSQLRKETIALLIRITNQTYIFVDKNWWQGLENSVRADLENRIYNLTVDFEKKIYPQITSLFGSEPKPGIDGDERITILFHPMNPDIGGYYNTGDLYSKIQSPRSNEREMIYLNPRHLTKPIAKSFLAHEFTHLVAINQTEIKRRKTEETWFLEALSEAAPAIVGYDANFSGSNLEKRMKSFLSSPKDSLVDWQNKSTDYGIVNIFIRYLIEKYGLSVLKDALFSDKVGIPSLNFSLQKNNYQEDFIEIFRDWAMTVLVNDCSLGKKFCYQDPNLKNLKIVPETNFLPMTGESVMTIYKNHKDFTPDWQRFVGGYGDLVLEFDGQDNALFDVSFLLCDKKESCKIQLLPLDPKQRGEIKIKNFDKEYSFLVLLTFPKTKLVGFDENNPFYNYSIKVKSGKTIEFSTSTPPSFIPSLCQIFNNLKYGMEGEEIRCLQSFLKNQGPEIYPEGLITGYFGPLTLSAVKKFQQKYWQEILAPWGLTKEQATGFVGSTTRAKINQLLSTSLVKNFSSPP